MHATSIAMGNQPRSAVFPRIGPRYPIPSYPMICPYWLVEEANEFSTCIWQYGTNADRCHWHRGEGRSFNLR